jgi:branched-chain amino acid aminotransferase
MAAADRIAYFNGRFVPEREVLVPFRDRGFKYGDAVFDTTRTFGHRVFKLAEHVERLYRSLRYLRIDPGLTPAAMIEITAEVLRRNLALLEPDEDYWVTQRVSRGLDASAREIWPEHQGSTVIVECVPLPLRERATLYRDGIRVITPSVRRTPHDALSPRVKTHNYLNLVAADLEVRAQDPGAWAVLLDRAGNLCEGLGSNIFLVQSRTVLTPREQTVLSGISRETVIDLAREAGLTVIEKDLDLYDAYNAEEAFLTSTSLCICPIASMNGARIGSTVPGHGSAVPGPITRQLTEAYCRFVDFDFVAQYLKRLG